MPNVFGIDFGTTNSCVGFPARGKVYAAQDSGGQKVIPSVVYFYKRNDTVRVMVGRNAKAKYVENPFCTIHSIKRFLGKSYDSEDVRKAQEQYYYVLAKDETVGEQEANIMVRINEFDLELSPADIAVYLFKYLKQITEQYTKGAMEYCVITMPTTFKARYTAAIKQIAKLSGLQIVGLLDEPTASAYTFGQTTKADHTIAVYDLGGGTFDFAILRRKGSEYETIAQMGDAWLGGDDFDQAIIEFLLKEFQNSTKNRRFANGEIYREGIRITNKDILRAIRIEAENAKCALSDTQNTMIHIPNVIPEIQAGCDMNIRLSRDLLEYVVSDKVEQTVSLSLDALENASTVDSSLKLDSLVIVGGQARMPRVRQRLKEVFGDIIYEEVMPDEAVAFGATIYGNTVALGG